MPEPKSRVKKPIYVSAEERARNQEILDSYRRRFPPKTYRAETVFAKKGSAQTYVETGRFLDEADARRSADMFLAALNEVSGGKWKLVSVSGRDMSGPDACPEP